MSSINRQRHKPGGESACAEIDHRRGSGRNMDSFMRLIGFVNVVAIVVVAGLIQSAAAATNHVVGDSTGWRIPPAAQFYANWASGKTFKVGDTLTFNFNALQHDVAEVTKAEYDACTSNKPIGSIITTNPANVTLNSTGNHYYLCTISGHCNAGQKLAINVVSSSTAAPSSAPSVSPSASPTPRISPSNPSPAPAVPGSSPSPAPTVSTPSPSPAVPGSSPSPAPTVSAPSPSPTAGVSPGPAPTPTPTASSGPSPSPTASSGPSQSPTPPSISPSSPPTVPSGGSPPPNSNGPSSSPPNEPTGTPPATTESPPPPNSAFSLSSSSRAMAFSIAILFAFFI